MIDGQREAFIDGGHVDDLKAAVDQLLDSGAQSLMIMASERDHWQPEALASFLQNLKVPVFGGVFPNIIYKAKRYSSGTLILGFSATLEVAIVSGLSDRSGLEPQLQHLAPMLARAKALITLVDGLATNLEAFVESLYEMAGAHIPVVGGGAGYLDFVQRPSLFTNAGMIGDAALLIALPLVLHSGIAHGWRKLEGPFLVTKSHANVLEELNYCPAFEVYRDAVEAHSGLRFADSDFFTIAKTYPLGIESVDGDFLVRDPIKQIDNTLISIGEIPQNATVYLLKGDAATLIESAGDAACKAFDHRLRRMDGEPPQAYGALVFDCISRVLFLDEAFAAELQVIETALPGACNVVGALTLGEIARSNCGLIELMNKSTVVAVL